MDSPTTSSILTACRRRTAPSGKPAEAVRRHHVVGREMTSEIGSAVVFEFCSQLVDLVIGVGHDGSDGHCLAFARKRFVGLLSEHLA